MFLEMLSYKIILYIKYLKLEIHYSPNRALQTVPNKTGPTAVGYTIMQREVGLRLKIIHSCFVAVVVNQQFSTATVLFQDSFFQHRHKF